MAVRNLEDAVVSACRTILGSPLREEMDDRDKDRLEKILSRAPKFGDYYALSVSFRIRTEGGEIPTGSLSFDCVFSSEDSQVETDEAGDEWRSVSMKVRFHYGSMVQPSPALALVQILGMERVARLAILLQEEDLRGPLRAHLRTRAEREEKETVARVASEMSRMFESATSGPALGRLKVGKSVPVTSSLPVSDDPYVWSSPGKNGKLFNMYVRSDGAYVRRVK
jgi:hypothetical protein